MIRGRILLLLFLTCFVAIIVRLFYVQVMQGDVYAQDLIRTQQLLPERGKIYDRHGEPIAINKPVFDVIAEPENITVSKDEVVKKLDEVLEMGESTLEARLDMTRIWVPIAKGLTIEEKTSIHDKNIDGITFEEYTTRYYPEASLSAHLLGFVGKTESGDDIGYFGIEGFFEKELRGLPGFIKSERDVFNKPIFVGTQKRIQPEDGRDLTLTIDKNVQNIVKDELVSAIERYSADEICATIADPLTMEILAMACVPDFDPKRYFEFSDEYFRNTVVSTVYEPGSTFKPLIMAAAIEEEKIKPDDTMDEKGAIKLGEFTIQNWDDTYAGKITMTEILEKSSNIGMVYVGEQLGNDLLYEYIERYGFFERTGIGLQGEVPGNIKPRNAWFETDYATATFGQGIAITQLQLISSFSSLINGGNLMRPYIVKEIGDSNKPRIQEPHLIRKVLSEETSAIMKQMLQSSVEQAELSFELPEGYSIGGKTGTAQVAVGGTYDDSQSIASFIGFAPVDKPQFVTLVVVKNPKTSIWGSETAAPVFFNIARELFVYYNIVPTKSE